MNKIPFLKTAALLAMLFLTSAVCRFPAEEEKSRPIHTAQTALSPSSSSAGTERLPPEVQDHRYYREWDSARWGYYRMGADRALRTGKGITIAVVDSGLEGKSSVARGMKERIAKLRDFIDYRSRLDRLTDRTGHGTAVAAIIAAGKTPQYAGIAPEAKLMIVKVSNEEGYTKDFITARGISWAVENGADVINLSMATNEEISSAIADTIDGAGERNIPVVIAAGNDGEGALNNMAKSSHPIVVSASDRDDEAAAYASSGQRIDFIAPGTEILAPDRESGYVTVSGTSYAAAHVTGAVALALEAGAPRKREELMAYLKKACVSLNLGADKEGGGMIRTDRIP